MIFRAPLCIYCCPTNRIMSCKGCGRNSIQAFAWRGCGKPLNIKIAGVLTEIITQDLRNTKVQYCIGPSVRVLFQYKTVFTWIWNVNPENSSLCKINVLALLFNSKLFKEKVRLFKLLFFCRTWIVLFTPRPPPVPCRCVQPFRWNISWYENLYGHQFYIEQFSRSRSRPTASVFLTQISWSF